MKALGILFLVSISTDLAGSDIKIGLFYGNTIESVVVSIVQGEYSLTGNSKKISAAGSGSIFQVDILNSEIYVHDANGSNGPFLQVSFVPADKNCEFMIRPLFPALPPKESDDRLDIEADEIFLKLINTIDFEKYIAGSVEAEGGINALSEYYKAQAVLVRTFAIRNYSRHAHQGFNLCDNVHCQAYNGKSRMNKDISTAVKQTEGMILSDLKGKPVITAYHSSCGGITASSSIEWNNHLYYLVPVQDPFCEKSKNRNWQKIIPASDWNAYLLKCGYTNYNMSSEGEKPRRKYIDSTEHKITMAETRRHFNLKSSWFYLEKKDGHIVVHGHGYGHGLGLCQEGAIEMARVGYTYVDILMFYYHNVFICKK